MSLIDEKLSQLGLIISDLTIEIKKLKEKLKRTEDDYWDAYLNLQNTKEELEKFQKEELRGAVSTYR